jgi:hypothetical protein
VHQSTYEMCLQVILQRAEVCTFDATPTMMAR